jgi:hypothetical protein
MPDATSVVNGMAGQQVPLRPSKNPLVHDNARKQANGGHEHQQQSTKPRWGVKRVKAATYPPRSGFALAIVVLIMLGSWRVRPSGAGTLGSISGRFGLLLLFLVAGGGRWRHGCAA